MKTLISVLVVLFLVVSPTQSAPTSSDEVSSTSPHTSTPATNTSNTTTRKSQSSISTSTTTTETPESPTTSGDQIEFTSYQNTSTFTCMGKVTGYYADVKLNCRVYHFCTQMDGLDGPSYQRMSYLCLENSYFDQRDLNCVKETDLKVSCDKAEEEYEKSNKQFDPKEESQPSMSDNFAANLMMNPITRFIAGR